MHSYLPITFYKWIFRNLVVHLNQGVSIRRNGMRINDGIDVRNPFLSPELGGQYIPEYQPGT